MGVHFVHAGATVSLQNSMVNVSESNGAVDVCVVLDDVMDGLRRSIILNFTSVEGEAGSSLMNKY